MKRLIPLLTVFITASCQKQIMPVQYAPDFLEADDFRVSKKIKDPAPELPAPAPTNNGDTEDVPPAVIYIDADSHTVSTGAGWDYYAPIDATDAGLSDAQLQEVRAIVAADYGTLNVIVTLDSSVFNAAARGVRALVTQSYIWYGYTAGVAIINSFTTYGKPSPCFIFSSVLNYNVSRIAFTVSHEAGHALNLRHQEDFNQYCQRTSSYSLGKIMGAADANGVRLWAIGPTGTCTNIQYDLDQLSKKVGWK